MSSNLNEDAVPAAAGYDPAEERRLFLSFHGRVLEHLGIQMYQSPVNALAEMVANAWDADAPSVDIALPDGTDGRFVVKDDGKGMTFTECQQYFLNVGRNRRGADPQQRTAGGRPVLGRKGIGKFAGFGVARVMTIDTVSGATGERTVFELRLPDLLDEDEYVGTDPKEVTVLVYEAPSEERRAEHGTAVTLSDLTLRRTPNSEQFAQSMARRFLARQDQTGFLITVNGEELPESLDLRRVQFVFPAAFTQDELPDEVTVTDEGWGEETLAGHRIRWRFLFHHEPVEDDELRGVAIYVKEKLAQRPFTFQTTQGVTGQQGMEYLTGQVEADFIDLQESDLIATERQRINWDNEATTPLLEWGQRRLRQTLRAWSSRRGEERVRQLEEKLTRFSPRLERLNRHEAKTVRTALKRVATLPRLSHEQFEGLSDGILTAWERGRLHDLIFDISKAEDMSADQLLEILIEARVVTALNTAEAVKTKLLAVWGLKERVERRELENAVRNFIAENPWLVSPEWETFRVERGLQNMLDDVAEEVGFTAAEYNGRIDLVLASGAQLLIMEFMRPGLTINWDHISRFSRYVQTIRARLQPQTAQDYRAELVRGYLVADRLERHPAISRELERLRVDGMEAMNWETLLSRSVNSWRDFLFVLGNRSPEDFRLRALLEDRVGPADDGEEGEEMAEAGAAMPE